MCHSPLIGRRRGGGGGGAARLLREADALSNTQQKGIFILHASFSFLPGQLLFSFPFFNFSIVLFLSSKTILRFFHCFVFSMCHPDSLHDNQRILLLCFSQASLQRGTGLCFNKHPWKTQLRGLSKNTLWPVSFPSWIWSFFRSTTAIRYINFK